MSDDFAEPAWLPESLRRIEQKLNYVADVFHDWAIRDARREKEEKLRKRLTAALADVLPMARLWLQPCEPGHPGWRALELAIEVLDEARDT